MPPCRVHHSAEIISYSGAQRACRRSPRTSMRWTSMRWRSTGSYRPAGTSGRVASSSGWAPTGPGARSPCGPHGQRLWHGVHRRVGTLRRPALRRPTTDLMAGGHGRPRRPRRCAGPPHPAEQPKASPRACRSTVLPCAGHSAPTLDSPSCESPGDTAYTVALSPAGGACWHLVVTSARWTALPSAVPAGSARHLPRWCGVLLRRRGVIGAQ